MLSIVRPVRVLRANNAHHGNVQTLLERLLVEVVAANYRYFLHEYLNNSVEVKTGPERWCWPPLLANERQVSCLFAHALSSVCPVSRPEMAINRGQRKDEIDEQSGSKDPNGRIDFYASFGQRSIALELKRVAISTVGRSNGWKGLAHQWATVGRQAQQALSHMRKSKQDFPYAAGIGLLVIRVSRGVTSRKADDDVQRSAADRFTDLLEEVGKATKPDFLAAYRPPAEMQVIEGWGKDGNGVKVFPGVIFAATVHVRDA